ncbi:MAG: TetR/AcrR family transcriptional regulator, partial [Smithellaceae bacterium]
MIEKRRTAKKDYIAKKAIDVFSALGYKESSLQDIATKGKFSKAGIYHYFKSKSELLSYILLSNTDSFFNRLEKSLASALKERLNPQETFEKLIRTYADELLSNIKVSLLILRERHQLTGAKKKILTEQERAIFRLIRDRLKHV